MDRFVTYLGMIWRGAIQAITTGAESLWQLDVATARDPSRTTHSPCCGCNGHRPNGGIPLLPLRAGWVSFLAEKRLVGWIEPSILLSLSAALGARRRRSTDLLKIGWQITLGCS